MTVQSQILNSMCVGLFVCLGAVSTARLTFASMVLAATIHSASENPASENPASEFDGNLAFESNATQEFIPQQSELDFSRRSVEGRVIQPGHRGQAVVRVQRILSTLGLSRLETDGLYTQATARAVEAFQSVHSLPMTGHVDRETWNALHQAVQSSESALSEPLDLGDSPSFSSSPSSFSDTLGVSRDPINGGETANNSLSATTSGTVSDGTDDSLEESEATPTPFYGNHSYVLLAMSGVGIGVGFYLLGRWSAERSHRKKHQLAKTFALVKRYALRAGKPTPETTADLSQSSDHPSASQLSVDSEATGDSAENLHRPSVDIIKPTRLSTMTSVDSLIEELNSADSMQCRRVIWELGQRGTTEAIQPLLDRMMTADSQQKGLILGAIAEISIRTLTPMNRALVLALQDDSSDVRKNAIRDVARVYELMAQVSVILRHATHDDHPEVRQTACWAIDQLNRMRTVPSVDGALDRSLDRSLGHSLNHSWEHSLNHSLEDSRPPSPQVRKGAG